MDGVGVLPSLVDNVSFLPLFLPTGVGGRFEAYAREGTVVPEVTLVREAVADEAELALLGVLLDGVEEIILGDLC